MSDRSIALRYARALYEEASTRSRVREVDEDVEMLRESLDAAPQIGRLLRTPVVSAEKKSRVLEQLFKSRLQPLTFRFLNLLVDKEREEILPEILAAYRRLRDEQEGVVEASATVAMPFTDGSMAALQKAVEDMTGRRVRLSVRHDPALLGGIVVRIGDTVYDGSVSHQLQTLREQLHAGRRFANGA